MKKIIVSIFLFVLINAISTIEQKSDNPRLVFFVKHVHQPQNDLLQISLKIESKDQSLVNAIKKGASSVEEIKTYAEEFCEKNAKKKGECKEVVEADEFQIKPQYQRIRKQPVFMGFTVTNEMTIALKSADNIGYLVDRILTKQEAILENFEWKQSKDNNVNQQAIAEGMDEGKGLCEQLGLKLGKIINVAEVHASQAENKGQSDDEQEEQDEDKQQNEENLTVFKFQVECEPKTKIKAKKQ